ncbi:MAG TPA: 5'/3'-nucleotidase SurE, partial [Spongiibacteraceae bacterium]|nr:5'/3'-nucleotidase SurE [Spongiibacteraceae bacterium]
MTKHFFVRTLISTTITALLTTLPSQAHALNILLTNDDGVTANVKALKTALDNAGHDVLIAVPCSNQSGKGASINFLSPITPLTTACRGGAAAAGAAGIGPVDAVTGLSNAYYANGTPIMALLYGLDVLAPQRWGKAPDLVISGPNEGQNVGGIVISSGTVSNAQFAIHRGLPAIAVSADTNTTDNPTLAAEAAALTVQLLDKLEQRSGHRGILPKGYA